MIEEWVQRAVAELERLLTSAGHEAWSHTLGLLDPFWGLAFWGVVIVVACVAAGWFFNVLRPVAGAVAMGTVLFLVGFWKGESAEQLRSKQHGHKDQAKSQRPPAQGPGRRQG